MVLEQRLGETFHIIGGGHFGRLAAERLLARDAGAGIRVVEQDRQALAALRSRFPGPAVRIIAADAVDYVCGQLERQDNGGEWLVPTVPMHLAAAVIERVTGRRRQAWKELPPLPNVVAGPGGEVYSSLADFTCPDDCPQPVDHCYTTGEPREKSLVQILEALDYHGLPAVVLPSRQLAPGVGGFTVAALRAVIVAVRNPGLTSMVFSTAFLCHGVSNIFGPLPEAGK